MILKPLFAPAAVVLATLALPASALADGPLPVSDAARPLLTEDPFPAIIYIPLESQTFTQLCPVAGNTGGSSALNCGFLGDVTLDLWSTDGTEQQALVDGVTAAVAPYGVRVTTDRPPDYVPYHMLLVSNFDFENDNNTGEACVLSTTGSSCDGVKRNGIGLVVNSISQPTDMTTTCENPDILTSALYAVGRLAGLEGSDVATDPMLYPPDFNNPATMFQDSCGSVTIDQPACNTLSHQVHCNDMAGMINSHQELLAVFGPTLAEDTTPPELSNIVPADGETFMAGTQITADVDITEDSDIVAVRWTFKGDALADAPTIVPGEITQCTNKVCDNEWSTRWIDMRASTQDWAMKIGLPPGDYEITLEVSDLTGNEVTNTVNVTVEGGAGETSGGSTSTSTSTTTGGSTSTTGDTDTEGGSDSDSSGGGDGDGGGCRVGATPAAPLGLLALFGLGAVIRRRR